MFLLLLLFGVVLLFWLLVVVVVVVGALTPRCLNIDKPLPAANGRHKRACPGGRGGGGGGCAE